MPDYYVSAKANGDSGNALTPATAKQHLRPVIFFLNRSLNQNIWLERGYFYDVDAVGNGMPGIVASHVKIRPYGTGGKPRLDGRNWIAPGSSRFTYVGTATGPEGGHVWKLQIGTANTIWRLWCKAVNNGIRLEDRTEGVALRTTPDATAQNETAIRAALSSFSPWHAGDTTLGFRLYMWTPSDSIDPADYWEGIAFIQSGAGTLGFDSGFSINRSQDILIEDIDVTAPRINSVFVNATDTDPITCNSIRVRNVNATHVTTAYRVRQTTTAAGIAGGLVAIFDVLFTKCIANTNTSPDEQETDNALYSRLSGASDLFSFTGKIENVRAEDCTSINGMHVGAVFGVIDAKPSLPRKTGFRRHKVIAESWTAYSRGYTNYLCEDSCFFDQCVADSMNVRSQFSGGVLITSPVSINMRKSLRKNQNTDGHFVIESGVGNPGTAGITGDDRFVYQYPSNLRIYNPTLGPCKGAPIQFNAYLPTPALIAAGANAAPFPAGSVTIKNMNLVDTDADRAGFPVVEMYAETSKDAIASQNIDTANIYKSGETPTVSVNLSNIGTTVTPVTSAVGFNSITTVNPMLDENLRPKQGSPLIGNGKNVGLKKDNLGKLFKSKPTIGAYESPVPKVRNLRAF